LTEGPSPFEKSEAENRFHLPGGVVSTLAQARTRLAIHGGIGAALFVAAGLAAGAMSPGCGSSGDGADGGSEGSGSDCVPYVAADNVFEDFASWKIHLHLTKSFALAPNDAGPDGDPVHGESPRDIYVNLGSAGGPPCPAAGATEFPIGTILVKVMSQSNLQAKDVFAQVKHGCGFNTGPSQADGWEWFDLLAAQNGGPMPPIILWHGGTPPASSQYGGNPTECNVCHSLMGAGNDSVITSELDVKNLPCK
jgi:hypothetical protein